MTTDAKGSFHDRLRKHLVDVLEHGSLTFTDLLKSSRGCDPSVLELVVGELAADGIACQSQRGDAETPVWGLRESSHRPRDRRAFSHSPFNLAAPFSKGKDRRAQEVIQSVLGSLPEPTPAYFQWWFTEQTCGRLLRFGLGLSGTCRPTAFLGCSSLGAIFSHFAIDVTILDIDKVLLDRLSGLCSDGAALTPYDALCPPDRAALGAFQTVFVDPPWSASMLPVFLTRGASLLREGGKLMISCPQTFTRPTIADERRQFLSLARDLGLALLTSIDSATEYQVPPFEYHAYQEVGTSLTTPWRRGDLFVFVKTASSSEPSCPVPQETPSHWDQFSFLSTRVFLRRDGEQERGKPRIMPLSNARNSRYTSTSSRSPLWSSASLVTSRNCIARAFGRAALSDILGVLAMRWPTVAIPGELPNAARVAEVHRSLCALLDTDG